MEWKKARKKEKHNFTRKLHKQYQDGWLTLRDLLHCTTSTGATRTGCHMRLTRTFSTPMDLLAAPVENGLLGNTHTHALRRGPEPCHLPEREEGPAGLLWHSDHLLSPANTQHGRVTRSQGALSHKHTHTYTHACTSKLASFFSCLFLFSSHFNHTLCFPHWVHPPPVSFILPSNPPPPVPSFHPSCSHPH